MTITWGERPKRMASMESPNKYEADREYWVAGTLSATDAVFTIAGNTPAIDVESCVDPNTGEAIPLFRNKFAPTEEGGGVWTVKVHYDGTPNQYDLTFTVGVQTTKIRQAKVHISVYDVLNGGSFDGEGDFTEGIPDFKGAIGLTGEGANISVEGVDTQIGKLEFSITKKLKASALAAGYLFIVADMTPSVNDDIFSLVWKSQVFAFPKGSVLFRGATMKQTSDDDLELTYYFAYSKNEDGLVADAWDDTKTYFAGNQVTYGGFLWQAIALNTGVTPAGPPKWQNIGADGALRVGNSDPIIKEGWQIAWPWYTAAENNGCIIQTPRAVVIDQVLDYGSFDDLDL